MGIKLKKNKGEIMPREFSCVIEKAIDGDTFDVSADLGFDINIKIRIRILGINSQEMHDSDKDKKDLAIKAKIEAVKWNGKRGLVAVYKKDKYGRWIADLKYDGVDYAQKMLDLGLAQPAIYDFVSGEQK